MHWLLIYDDTHTNKLKAGTKCVVPVWIKQFLFRFTFIHVRADVFGTRTGYTVNTYIEMHTHIHLCI